MYTKATTPEEVFAAAAGRADDLRKLDTLIRETAPELKPYILSGMLAYGPFHYVYASGREGDWAVVSLAPQKHHLSLYICAVKDNSYLAELHGADLGHTSTGKSCIRFNTIDDLNLEQIRHIIREAAEWWKVQPEPVAPPALV